MPYDPRKLSIEEREARGRLAGLATVQYVDNCAVLLSEPGAIAAELPVLQWPSRDTLTLPLPLQLGIAIAVTRSVFEDKPDGLLGLGRLEHDDAYEMPDGSGIPMTFLGSVRRALLPLSAARSKKETIALWFAIRPPRGTIPEDRTDPGDSWAAYNDWPCKNIPLFSAPIATVDNAEGEIQEEWQVWLKKLTFHNFAGGREGFSDTYELVINRPGKGLPVVLDTGDLPLDERWNPDKQHIALPAFTVPSGHVMDDVSITYEFEGSDGSTVRH
ncbi:hypothetical protein BV20DRAFT_729497 [Pilatotrama ljubarskyi]|nr:hypothetical protein BV20DRAFT_729497 [Pilatotrama ljubarskyi]